MRTRLIFIILLAFFSLTAWAQKSLPLSSVQHRLDLVPYASILRDPTGTLTVTAAAASPNWKPLAGQFNEGFTRDALWLRIDLDRASSAPHDWFLEVNNAVLDDLRLFHQTESGTRVSHRSGEDVPRNTWDTSYRNPIFRLDLNAPGRHTLLLRIASRNSISAQILLWQAGDFGAASRRESLAYGLLLGFYATIVLIHLFFWRQTGEAVGGWYALYVAVSFCHIAISYGYVQQYTGLPGRISDIVLSLLICSSIGIGAKMCIEVLELRTQMPRTARWLRYSMTTVSIVTSLLAVTVSYAAGVAPAQLTAFVEVGVFLVISLKLLRQGHRPAGFFLAAFGFYCTGTMLRVARNFMLLPPNLLTENSFQIGAVAHMVLMSLAISDRYKMLRATAEQAKTEALRLKTEHAERLEREVTLRTASLTEEIKQRKLLETELRKSLEIEKTARQQQRDFVSMVSHEFRTPLTIIDTSTQRIAGSKPPPATQERCTNIREATRRMTRLMDEFLSLDRIDGDLHAFTAKDEDTEELIRSAASEWEHGSLVLSLENLPPCISCDAGLLKIALRNLLANAIRHSPVGIPVHFSASGIENGGVEFAAENQGESIPEDEIPKLFQKYFRGRSAQGKPGAGLGLYLVDRIAKSHGGNISVASTPASTRFTLTLPRASCTGQL